MVNDFLLRGISELQLAEKKTATMMRVCDDDEGDDGGDDAFQNPINREHELEIFGLEGAAFLLACLLLLVINHHPIFDSTGK